MRNDAKKLLEEIRNLASTVGKNITILSLCGTHENTISKYGIRQIVPSCIKLVPGPGCPVCVINDEEIARFLYFIENFDGIVTCFGDVSQLKYHGISLATAGGSKIKIVYSIFDAVKIAEKNKSKDIVHIAVGFETTLPSTAIAILEAPSNFYVFNAHRFFIPAIPALLSSTKRKVDALICPGHVSAITGIRPYRSILRRFPLPMVVSGFEALDVLESVKIVLDLLVEGETDVINQYGRVVRENGNVEAKKLIRMVFGSCDCEWRGLGKIKNSKPTIKKKWEDRDAEKVFEKIFQKFEFREDPAKKLCRCGDVLLANITPEDCPLFGRVCSPSNPVGPCMVSIEGACRIWCDSLDGGHLREHSEREREW